MTKKTCLSHFAGFVVLFTLAAPTPTNALIDCNRNLADDASDIVNGLSMDCNENGIPDECDVVEGMEFSSAASIDGIAGPFGLASGDVDDDGDEDLVVASSAANAVTIVLSNGNGTFEQPIEVAVGARPVSVVISQFNNDVLPDLAAANFEGDSVSVLLGEGLDETGRPTFSPAVEIAVGAGPRFLAAADLDGDQDVDLAVVNQFSDSVTLLINDGSGGFSTADPLAVGGQPISVTAADLNGDDLPDLAVANFFSNNFSILLNAAESPPASPMLFALPFYVASADLDGDDDVDLIVANSASGTVSVMLNDGSGVFEDGGDFDVGNTPQWISVADFDGDQVQDLIVVNAGSDDVTLLLGNGDATFSAVGSFATGALPSSAAVLDLNSDNDLDLAVANEESGSLSLLLYQALAAASNDCNGNETPDECETDCNGNGVPDDCDIADGTSDDCDDDGRPDECQADSDGDGLIDPCDPTPNGPPVEPDGRRGCGACGALGSIGLALMLVGLGGIKMLSRVGRRSYL